MNIVWTQPQRDFVRDNAPKMTDAQIAVKLTDISGREVTLQAVRKQRQKMKLKKGHGRGVCKVISAPSDK